MPFDDKTKQISKKFFYDMNNFSKNDTFSQFSYQSKIHFMLTCLIASKDGYGLSLEEIFEAIDLQIASRSTIQKVLENGVAIGFYSKIKSISDKRKKLYFLTKESKDFFINWVKRQKEIFKEII